MIPTFFDATPELLGIKVMYDKQQYIEQKTVTPLYMRVFIERLDRTEECIINLFYPETDFHINIMRKDKEDHLTMCEYLGGTDNSINIKGTIDNGIPTLLNGVQFWEDRKLTGIFKAGDKK